MKTNSELLKLMLQFSSDFAEVLKLWGQDAKMIDAINKDTQNIFYESNSYTWPENMAPKFIEASFFVDEPVTRETFNIYIHQTYFGEGHLDEEDEKNIQKQLDDVFKDLPEIVSRKELTQHLIDTKVVDDVDKDFFEAVKDGLYNQTFTNLDEITSKKSLNVAIDEIRKQDEALNMKLASYEYEMRENKTKTLIKSSNDWDYVDKKNLNMVGMLYLDYETQRVNIQTTVADVLKEHSNSAKRMLASGRDFVIKSPMSELNVTRVAKTGTGLSNADGMARNAVLKKCKNEFQKEKDNAVKYGHTAEDNFLKEASVASELASDLKKQAELKLKNLNFDKQTQLDKLSEKLKKGLEEKETIEAEKEKVNLSFDMKIKTLQKEIEENKFTSQAKEIVSKANKELTKLNINKENIEYAAFGNTGNRMRVQQAFNKLSDSEKVEILKVFEEKKKEYASLHNALEKELDIRKSAKDKSLVSEVQEKLNKLIEKEKRLSSNKGFLLDKTDNAKELKKEAKEKVKETKQPEKEKDFGFERCREN